MSRQARVGARRWRRRGSVGAQEPVETVEEQVEPELELVAVVIARLEDVLGRQLGEVRVLLGGELRQDRLRYILDRLGGVERQAGFLKSEAVDIAVEQRVGVRGHLDREAGAPQRTDHRVVLPQRRGSGVVRDSMSGIAQGWRASTRRADIAR